MFKKSLLAVSILLLIFLVSVVKIIWAFFRTTQSGSPKLPINADHMDTPFIEEIHQELGDKKRQSRRLKHDTMKLTRIEIKTIDHIERYLKDIIKIIKESGSTLSKKQIKEGLFIKESDLDSEIQEWLDAK